MRLATQRSQASHRPSVALRLFLLALSPLLLAVGCGRPSLEERVPLPESPFEDQLLDGFTNTAPIAVDEKSKLRDVTLTLDSKSVFIDPTNIPPGDSAVRRIQFRADVSFTVAVNKEFAYNRNNWGIFFATPENDGLNRVYRARDSDKKLKIVRDGISPNLESTVITQGAKGIIEIQIDLDEAEWARIRDLRSKEEGSKRSQITVKLFYSIRDPFTTTADTDGTSILEAIRLQNDIGFIQDPVKLSIQGTSSGSLTLAFDGPTKTDAILPSQDYAAVGPSVLSGYLLMYWKEGDCSDADWIFEANPQVLRNRAEPAPRFSCAYGSVVDRSLAPGQCPLGCSTEPGEDAEAKYFARSGVLPSEEEVAVPVASGACYTVVRVPAGRRTFSITGLTDNATYGVMAWPIDSSGSVGATRSSCTQGVPERVPMAAAADVSPSVRDCFVATAASGSPSSLTVHYWRIVRDTMLDPLGVSPLYYRHARDWAAWLESRPFLKPVVNDLLLFWGETLVNLEVSFHRLRQAFGAFESKVQRLESEVRERWLNLRAQLGTEASASEPREESDLPENERERTKVLPSQESIDAATQDLAPSKRLEPTPREPTDEAPNKALVPPNATSGYETNESSSSETDEPSKTLPPPMDSSRGQDLDRKSRFPVGSAASASRFGGGIFQPEASETWDAFYPSGSPVRIALQHTFRVVDLLGELGLGMTGSLQFHGGKVPEVLPDGSRSSAAVVGRRIKYMSTGLYLTADYRLRYMEAPPVAPRLMVSIGGERLRETASENPVAGADAKGNTVQSGRFGYTLVKPMALMGGSLEFSARGIFGPRAFSTALAYGAQDFLLSLDAVVSRDFSGHTFHQNGLHLGGSIVLLLE